MALHVSLLDFGVPQGSVLGHKFHLPHGDTAAHHLASCIKWLHGQISAHCHSRRLAGSILVNISSTRRNYVALHTLS